MSKLHIALLFGLGSIAQTSYGEAFDSCPGTAFSYARYPQPQSMVSTSPQVLAKRYKPMLE